MALGHHVVKIRKITIKRKNVGSIESSWAQKHGKNVNKYLKKMSENGHLDTPEVKF